MTMFRRLTTRGRPDPDLVRPAEDVQSDLAQSGGEVESDLAQSGGEVDATVEEEDPFLVEAQATVDAFRALYKGLEVPESLRQELGDGPTKNETCFDPNQFFGVLDKLQMEPGWTLDYTYDYNELGGQPKLVARDASSPACMTDPEVKCVTDGVWEHMLVQPDKEGLFQVLVLRSMGEQFYQYWHASADMRLILTQGGLDAWRVEQFDAVDMEMKQEFWDATADLVFSGSAEMGDAGLRIEYVGVGWNSAPKKRVVTVSPVAPFAVTGEPGGTSEPMLDCFWCVTP